MQKSLTRHAVANAVQYAILFLLVGPGIGGTPFALGVVGFMATDSEQPLSLVLGAALTLVFAYLFGCVPALLAGFVVGAASAWVRGRWLYLVALLVGFAAPTAVFGWVDGSPPLEAWQGPVGFGALGALAALGCTWLARRSGLGRTA